MALVKFSAIVSEMIGRLNGSVLQRVRGSTIIRNQKVNLNSSRNNIFKTQINLVTLQQAWQALTAQERKLWEVYALFRNRPTRKLLTNSLGGQATFILENSIRLIHNQSGGALVPAILTTPIIDIPPGNVAFTSFTNNGVNFGYNTDQTFNTANAFFVIYLSRPLLSSQESVWNKRKLFALVITAGNFQTITAKYLEQFGALPAVGQFINSKIALYDKAKNTFGSFTEQRTEVTP